MFKELSVEDINEINGGWSIKVPLPWGVEVTIDSSDYEKVKNWYKNSYCKDQEYVADWLWDEIHNR